jgi:aspartyl-tRNA(Asn)/glutamyl-tRNA(Gln) amidotransferase subunit A
VHGYSKPLAGKRLALVTETLGKGVDPEVESAIRTAARHLETLGAVVEEVC